ncbi:hypothetical protein ACFL0X_02610, partial [Nanoarchaeota archaeon]
MEEGKYTQRAREQDERMGEIYREVQNLIPRDLRERARILYEEFMQLDSDLCSVVEGRDKESAVRIHNGVLDKRKYSLLVGLLDKK